MQEQSSEDRTRILRQAPSVRFGSKQWLFLCVHSQMKLTPYGHRGRLLLKRTGTKQTRRLFRWSRASSKFISKHVLCEPVDSEIPPTAYTWHPTWHPTWQNCIALGYSDDVVEIMPCFLPENRKIGSKKVCFREPLCAYLLQNAIKMTDVLLSRTWTHCTETDA